MAEWECQYATLRMKGLQAAVSSNAIGGWSWEVRRDDGSYERLRQDDADTKREAKDRAVAALFEIADLLALGEMNGDGEERWPKWPAAENELPAKFAPYNLREVAPLLFVGAFASPGFKVAWEWAAIFDFCGSSEEYLDEYPVVPEVFKFDDGNDVPEAALERAWQVANGRTAPVLFHCAQGLSRSAAVAYAVLRREGLEHDEALRRVQVPDEPKYPMKQTLASARRWSEG